MQFGTAIIRITVPDRADRVLEVTVTAWVTSGPSRCHTGLPTSNRWIGNICVACMDTIFEGVEVRSAEIAARVGAAAGNVIDHTRRINVRLAI